jgi:hypothetical protein
VTNGTYEQAYRLIIHTRMAYNVHENGLHLSTRSERDSVNRPRQRIKYIYDNKCNEENKFELPKALNSNIKFVANTFNTERITFNIGHLHLVWKKGRRESDSSGSLYNRHWLVTHVNSTHLVTRL